MNSTNDCSHLYSNILHAPKNFAQSQQNKSGNSFLSETSATVIVAGDVEAAGYTDYDTFEKALDIALFSWSRSLWCLIIPDTTCLQTRTMAERNAKERYRKFYVEPGNWNDFGAAAESIRNRKMLTQTTHAIFFAPQHATDTARLFSRVIRECIPFIKHDSSFISTTHQSEKYGPHLTS